MTAGDSKAVVAARARYEEAVRDVAKLRVLESFADARVCVAGFTGQVGSALVRVLTEANATALASAPMQLTGIARRDRGSVPDGFEAVYTDVADASLSAGRFTHVFYAAGVTSDYRSRPDDLVATQLVGLRAFLERADPETRIVFVSSARVYGRHPADDPLVEDSTALVASMDLDNLYDSGKRLAETLCLWHAERRGVHATVVRAGNLYGIDSAESGSAVNELVREAAATKRIDLTGNPSSLRNYCCTVDLAQGLVRAAAGGRPGRAYNIGSDEHLTTRELAQEIAGCFDTPIEIVAPRHHPDPPSYQRLALDRARRELGYAPRVAIRDVLPAVAAEVASRLETLAAQLA